MFHFKTAGKNDVTRYDSLHSFFMSDDTLFDFHTVKIYVFSSPLLKSPQSLAAVDQPVIPVRLAQLFRETLPKCHKLQTPPVDFVPLRENHGKRCVAARQAYKGLVKFECLPEH